MSKEKNPEEKKMMVNNALHRKLNIENYVCLYIPRATPTGTLEIQTFRAPPAAPTMLRMLKVQ
jgi:hypothetical protein